MHSDNSSIIFRRNRALGFVTNHVPAVARYVQSRKDTLITTCIGRFFQVYTASHFRLLYVSAAHPDVITALTADRSYIYTASNKCIFAWRSGKHKRHIYRGHTRNVHLLLPFGKNHLIAVDEENVLKVWDIFSETVYLDVAFNQKEFLVSAIAHPPTYINKIILGSHQGLLKIWNLKNNSLIYTFHGRNSRITCLEPAPALDIVAIGYFDGAVTLMNLKYNDVLMEFKQDWGCVTQITFRTDGPPLMATSSNNGNIVFWNLEEQKIMSQIQAHDDSVTTSICFHNEPILLTTSPDNSMKLWIFDMTDGGARLLRIREGHTASPLCIRYHGIQGTSILSSGEDSTLRVFNTISETLNRNMGKMTYKHKSLRKKNTFKEKNMRMPPIVQFTSETTREKEWDNIAAIHTGIVQTTTWSFHKNRMGDHRLVPKKFQNKIRSDFKTEATCLTLTHCGNFVIIGYSNGDIERFNIQSGLHRATYGNPAHKMAVMGIASDNLNQFVISGCSEGFLKFWHFKENVTKSATTLKFQDGIALMRAHRESALIAVVLVSFIVFVIDSDTKTIMRKFEGHTAKINDVTFSPDNRWVITAAMDSTIKVWDIPSSYMVDNFRVDHPCISLTMSPTGDFLATAHTNFLGIYLWANKMNFTQISLHSLDPVGEALYVGFAPYAYNECDLVQDVVNILTDVDKKELEEVDMKYETALSLSNELITMSGIETSRWQNLLDLETIKERNRAKKTQRATKQVPFFIPTLTGLSMEFKLNSTDVNDNSKIIKTATPNNLTVFGKLLADSAITQDFKICAEHLMQLGPSMIDFEIKLLCSPDDGSYLITTQFLRTIQYMFSTNIYFELAQSYLSIFLRTHGRNLFHSLEVMKAVQNILEIQESNWKKIEQKLIFGIGVVSALRNFAH